MESLQPYFDASHVTMKVNLDTLESAAKLPYLGRTTVYNNIDWEAL